MADFMKSQYHTFHGITISLNSAISTIDITPLLKDLRLKQVEVAKQIGLTRASLANIEKGRQKTMLHQINKIAEALRTDLILDLVPPRVSASVPDEPIVFAETDIREGLRAQAEQFVRRAPV
jgi:DNA-binding XRE family transcriptional regulator